MTPLPLPPLLLRRTGRQREGKSASMCVPSEAAAEARPKGSEEAAPKLSRNVVSFLLRIYL